MYWKFSVRDVLLVSVVTVSLALIPPPAQAAPEEGAGGRDLSAEMDRLNRQLEEIGDSLRALLANQQAELVLRRIELEERRLAPLDREMRNAENEVRDKEREIREMRTYIESARAEIEKAKREGEAEDQEDYRDEMKMMDKMIENQETELGVLQQRVFDLGDELAQGRDAVEALDEQLAEMLEARP